MITISGGTSAQTTAPTNNFTTFTGIAAFIGGLYQPQSLSGTPINAIKFTSGISTDLILGTVAQGNPFWVNSVGSSLYGFLQNQDNTNIGTTGEAYITDVTNYSNQEFLINALNQYRTIKPTIPGSPALPSGATDLRLYRVIVEGCTTCLSINP